MEHETATSEAETACKTARVELASAAVETACRRHRDAKTVAASREEERKRAFERRNLLQAALSMRDMLDDRLRSKALQEAIDAENADLQPRRDALRSIGADLIATLGQRATALRERQRSLLSMAEELTAAAREADSERAGAIETAQTERREAAQIDVNLVHARDFRAILKAEHVIESGEDAEAAAQRHAEAATSARKEAVALHLRAESADRDAAQHRERQGDLKAERSRLESEAEPLRAAIRDGEARRRDLAFHSIIVELSGEREVDPDADAVRSLLTDARGRCAAKMHEHERRHEVLQADRESLEATGLASVDTDVRVVADRLRESGIADAQPYAVYLSGILRSPGEVRCFAERDPARFVGIAVPNLNALDAARRLLASPPELNRPVTVAVASDTFLEAQTDRFVLPVDEPAAYDRVAARELRRRIETELGRVASSIETQQIRIERLENTLRVLDTWRARFGGGQLQAMLQEVDRKEARIAEIGGEMEALSQRIVDAEQCARDCRGRASERDDEAHACTERSRRAGEHHAQWEERTDGWRSAYLDHQKRTASAERIAQEKEAERDARAGEAREREQEATEAATRAAAMEREASEIAYAGPGGQTTGHLDDLRRDYEQNLEALKALERERVDRLRGQRDEIERALAEKEDRFQQTFGDLDRPEVEIEAARDGLRDAAAEADAVLEAARERASTARADADTAAREHRSETTRRTEEIRPELLIDMRSLRSDALSHVALEAEAMIVEQEAVATRESEAARRARQEAGRSEQTARECGGWAATLDGVIGDEAVPSEPVALPHQGEVRALVNGVVAALGRSREALRDAHKAVYESYDEIRKFTSSDTFRELQSEREVAAHLAANDPLAAAHNAERTAGLIDDRLKTIEHDLSRLDDDLQACVSELERLLRTALHILRRMIRDGRIPDHVPQFGGQPVFRMSADLSRVGAQQRREILRSYVTELAEIDRVPESGQDIAAELVDRMTAALGRSTLGIQLLKPKGQGDTEHMPIERVTVSGGELLTAAMMIYLVLARLRAEAMHSGSSEGGVLIMDNPLGKANKALLLKTQIGLANAMRIQLFYTTGVQDTNALAEFENIVRLRRNNQSRGSRRIHVEVEAMRAHIDRQPAGDTVRPAVAAE